MKYIYGIENVSFFDSYWAIIHFGSGLLLGLMLILLATRDKNKYLVVGIFLLILWELFEMLLRYFDTNNINIFLSLLPQAYYASESTINIVSDLIIGILGLLIVYRYKDRIRVINKEK